MRLWLSVALIVVNSGVGWGLAAERQAAPHGRDLRIDLPLSEASICAAARHWASVNDRLIGVECMAESKPQHSTAVLVHEQLDLTSMTPESSLQTILDRVPGYQKHTDGSLAVIRPKAKAGAGAPAMLDRTVPAFSLTNASLVDAAEAVNRLFDPGYTLTRLHIGGNGAAVDPSQRERLEHLYSLYNQRFVPAITLHLQNVTVEQILNQISIQTNTSWQVQFSSPAKQYQDATIDFIAAGGPVRSGGRVPVGRR